MKNKLIEFYIEYVNNYLTVSAYADATGLTEGDAIILLEMGKRYNNNVNYLETKEEIKQAVDAGMNVYCGNVGYKVIKDKFNQYMIVYSDTGYAIGLHGMEGTQYENKLNGTNFFTTNQ